MLPHYTDDGYEAARQRRRYASDPAYRLDRINRARVRQGYRPAASLDGTKLRIPINQGEEQ